MNYALQNRASKLRTTAIRRHLHHCALPAATTHSAPAQTRAANATAPRRKFYRGA